MATTKCISANATKLNHATIAQAGAVSSTGLTGNVPFSTLRAVNETLYGSHVYKAVSSPSSSNLGTALAYSAGTFSSFQKGQYVMMVAGRYLSGVASTLFQSPSNKIVQRVPNLIKTTHITHLTGIQWVGGNDGGPTYTFTKSATNLDFKVDQSILDVQLVYRVGKPLPVQKVVAVPYST